MSDRVRIQLGPLGQVLEVERGAPLQDILFDYGVEFPCGGQGDCRGCRVKLLSGELPVTAEEAAILLPEEIAAGWRLACRNRAEADLRLEIAQWEAVILGDTRAFEFTPQEGLGMAVDLGTTTLVAQLLDLETGNVLGVRSALNPQAAWGSDIMSRVEYAGAPDNAARLTESIRARIGEMAAELVGSARADGRVRHVVVVGNTVMHHLFCGVDVEPLSHVPFQPVRDGLELFRASELGWALSTDPPVRFLPCLGGFVGSDILAGILATRMQESPALVMLIDLGTNGEIVVGNRERMVCASTAAGPAFEGGRISMGMRAATGAISEVKLAGGRLACHVLGGGPPRGICGSGLVDAVATGLETGTIAPNGRLATDTGRWMLEPPVSLTQADIRELQLAKAAVAAGVRILLRRWGAGEEDVSRLYLAGAFGNYINQASARRIGLIGFAEQKVEPAGNTALLGAKLALFQAGSELEFAAVRRRVEHISLASDPEFQEIYADEMRFPE